MKKIMKSRIFLVIITMIICISGTLYAATTYKASDVSYTPNGGTEITVESALNDIYQIKKIGTALANDILKGKTAVVQGKLITGTMTSISKITINLTAYAHKVYNNGVTSTEKQSKITVVYDVSSATSNVSFNGSFGIGGDTGFCYLYKITVDNVTIE